MMLDGILSYIKFIKIKKLIYNLCLLFNRYDNVNAAICKDNPSIPCPDIIMMGTTQVNKKCYFIIDIFNINLFINFITIKKVGIQVQ